MNSDCCDLIDFDLVREKKRKEKRKDLRERQKRRILLWWDEVVEMARVVKWGCSYKRTTLIVCCINIVVALFVLRSLYASLYLYSNNNDLNNGNKFAVLFFFSSFCGMFINTIWFDFLFLFFKFLVLVVKYAPDQIRKMEESVRIRKANEPLQLVKIVSFF